MSDPAGEPIHVLHVDDDEALGEVAALHLERAGEDISVVTETSARDGLAFLEGESTVDCIVSDHDMPDMDGLEFLREVRETYPDMPFVLFTGKGSEEIASEAISAGVTEYLQKGTGTEQYELLANRIERAVAERRTREALEESERLFSRMTENLPGIVYRCRDEPGWPMEYVSDGCRELTGHEPAAFEDGELLWARDLTLDADEDRVRHKVRRALESGERFELTYRIRTATDEIRWVRERGIGIYEDGEVQFIEGFMTDVTDRKEREQELRDQREFVERLVDTLTDPFFLVAPDGALIRWNDRFSEVTGYADAEISTMEATDFVADSYVPTLRETLETAYEEGETQGVQVDIVTAEGRRRPFELRSAALFDDEGDPIGTVSVARDLSDRRKRRRELEQYRTLVENVGDPMYILDTDGWIRMANDALAEHLGYDKSEIVGATPAKFIPEEHVERGEEVIRDLLRNGDENATRTWELDHVTADGTRVRNENNIAVIYEGGTFAGSVGVMRDIQDRVERERELERYETIIQAVGDPVYALNEDGEFTFVNDAFESTMGYEPSELEGEHVSVLLPDGVEWEGRSNVEELLEDPDKRADTFEIDIRTADGDRVPCELHLALLPTDDGFRGTAGVVRDIQDRKRREERLAEFASVVSHDLRGPLNVIMGRVEMAKQEPNADHLDRAADAANKMDELIDDLLTLARRGRTVGDAEPVDLTTVAEEAWLTVETDRGRLETERSLTVEADPDRLRELFENLFRNAVEHGTAEPVPASPADETGDAGSPEPTDGTGSEVTVRVGATDRGFYVEDDGPGIPSENRDDVFEHGYTTSDDGTGLGLAIVGRIAEAHGWTVSAAESRSGGARFEFET